MGDLVELGGAQRAHPVRDARPGGERGDAGRARDLRPALRGEGRRLLVADVDDVDALLPAAVVDREDVAAREGEELRDAVGLERRAMSRPPWRVCAADSACAMGAIVRGRRAGAAIIRGLEHARARPAARPRRRPDGRLHITESRGIEQRVLRVGPLPEPQARSLAGFLLNREGAPDGEGPWRCAVAGGTRTIALTPPA
jgi:hypothetical protein